MRVAAAFPALALPARRLVVRRLSSASLQAQVQACIAPLMRFRSLQERDSKQDRIGVLDSLEDQVDACLAPFAGLHPLRELDLSSGIRIAVLDARA